MTIDFPILAEIKSHSNPKGFKTLLRHSKIHAPLDFSEYLLGIGLGYVGENNFYGIKAYLGYQDWEIHDAEITGLGFEYYRRISTWENWRIGLGGGASLLEGRDYTQDFDFRNNEWRILSGIRIW